METAAGGVTLPAAALPLVALNGTSARSWSRTVSSASAARTWGAFFVNLMVGRGRHELAPLRRPQGREPGLAQWQDSEDRQQLRVASWPGLLLSGCDVDLPAGLLRRQAGEGLQGCAPGAGRQPRRAHWPG